MENILSVDLSSEISPIVEEVRGRDYIEYGTEEWKNLISSISYRPLL